MNSSRIHQEVDGAVRILRLVRGRGNALDRATLTELEGAFAPGGENLPVVLTGRGRSFSTGLDLLECHPLDRRGMEATMEAFHRALRAAFLYPAPLVVALNGHALAGGALLALTGDRRLMVDAGGRFGIHGVHLGVSYPQVAVEILRHQLSRPVLEDLLYAGHIYEPPVAQRTGFIDRLVSEDELLARAREDAVELLRDGREGFGENKLRLRAHAARRIESMHPALAESWLDQWFDPETRARVGRARDALGGSGEVKPGA